MIFLFLLPLLFLVLFVLLGVKILAWVVRLVTGAGLRNKADRASQLRFMADFMELLAVISAALAVIILLNAVDIEINPLIVAFVIVVASFALTYFRKSSTMLAMSLIELVIWFSSQAAKWADDGAQAAPMLGTVIILSLTCLLAARLHRTGFRPKSFWNVYAVVGVFFLASFSLVLSSSAALDILNSFDEVTYSPTAAARIFFIAVASLSLLLATYLFSKAKLTVVEFSIYLVLFAAYAFMALTDVAYRDNIDSFYGSSGSATAYGSLWFLVSNALVGLQIYWLLSYGYKNRDRMLINLGTIYLLSVIIIKYFDFFSEVQRSLFFLGLGGILIGVGLVINYRLKAGRAELKQEEKTDA